MTLTAGAAVDRSVIGRLEGQLCLAAAVRTDSREVLAGSLAAVFLGVPASLASLRFVHEAFFGVESLLTGGEYKFFAAFLADQGLINKLVVIYRVVVFILEHCVYPLLSDKDLFLPLAGFSPASAPASCPDWTKGTYQPDCRKPQCSRKLSRSLRLERNSAFSTDFLSVPSRSAICPAVSPEMNSIQTLRSAGERIASIFRQRSA